MAEIKRWAERYKALCLLTGVFGLLLSPFLWPFFLAIAFQSLSIAVPLLLLWLMAHKVLGKGEGAAGTGQEAKEDAGGQNGEAAADEGQAGTEDAYALTWYRLEGKAEIIRILRKAEREGKRAYSISAEGVCSVKEGRRYVRMGVLRGFPRNRLHVLEREVKKDGLSAHVSKGNYLWIARGGFR